MVGELTATSAALSLIYQEVDNTGFLKCLLCYSESPEYPSSWAAASLRGTRSSWRHGWLQLQVLNWSPMAAPRAEVPTLA